MHINPRNRSQSGQILLVVVLAVVVSLTVGLSAASRTIVNTRVSTEQANSQKALSAAEAGVEELVNSGNITAVDGTGAAPKPLANNSNFQAKAVEVKGDGTKTKFKVENGGTIKQDEGADIWFSDTNFTAPSSFTNLYVYWTNAKNGSCDVNSSNPNPAIEIAVIGGTKAAPTMSRYALDHCARDNGFTSDASVQNGAYTIDGTTFDHRYNIPNATAFIARVIPVYADTTLAVTSDTSSLPLQGYIINSTGKSGNTVRQIKVFQGFPKVPVEFFPYNLFLP